MQYIVNPGIEWVTDKVVAAFLSHFIEFAPVSE